MYEGIVQELIDELGRLPGVGPKSAQRIAFHIVQTRSFDVSRLAEVLTQVRERIQFCEVCGNVSEQDKCVVCRDQRRDPTVLCVVEEPKDVAAIERTREFQGRYHVLGGAISPIEGIGPDDLNIRSLLHRLESGEVQEIIVATDPNLEGDATASYLSRLLASMGIRVSRLASGLPVGGDLEYADEVTLGRAFAGRQAMGDRRSIPTRPAVGGWATEAKPDPDETEAQRAPDEPAPDAPESRSDSEAKPAPDAPEARQASEAPEATSDPDARGASAPGIGWSQGPVGDAPASSRIE